MKMITFKAYSDGVDVRRLNATFRLHVCIAYGFVACTLWHALYMQ